MERWVAYAIAAMFFAGFTSVIAKNGLLGISGEVGLAIRTVVVFALVLLFAVLAIPRKDFDAVSRHNLVWLGLSGLTTAFSWVFYYKALKIGEVSTVALIDKGSFVVAVLLAWIFLGEKLTPRTLFGASLILTGLLVVAKK
jgi:transporter family protein